MTKQERRVYAAAYGSAIVVETLRMIDLTIAAKRSKSTIDLFDVFSAAKSPIEIQPAKDLLTEDEMKAVSDYARKRAKAMAESAVVSYKLDHAKSET